MCPSPSRSARPSPRSKPFPRKRILLMTPVDDQLKKMYHDYLAGFGIESFYPPQILRAHTDAQKLTSPTSNR